MLHRLLLLFLFSWAILLAAQTTRKTDTFNQSNSQKVKPNDNEQKKALISFDQTSFDLGQVLKDSTLTNDFVFKNNGNSPLLITYVRTSCHCTVATYPRYPILPGKTEKVVVTLDTKMLGKFSKKIAVYSNASNHYAKDIDGSRVLLEISWEVVDIIDTD